MKLLTLSALSLISCLSLGAPATAQADAIMNITVRSARRSEAAARWGPVVREVCLSVRTPWDRAYSAGVLSCIGALACAPARELVRKSEGCWCQGGPLWLAETLCFT